MDRPSRLIGFTAISSIGINVIVGEQYLSIILPGETFKHSFEEAGLEENICPEPSRMRERQLTP